MSKRWSSWRGRGSSKRSRPFTRGTPSSTPQAPDTSPYFGWVDYFPDEFYVPGSPLAARLDILVSVFEEILTNTTPFEEISVKGSLTIDIHSFVNKPAIQEGIPDLLELLKNTPDVTIRSLSLAIYHVLSSQENGTQAIHSLPLVIARMSHFTPTTLLKDLRANLYGKFATVHGTVVRVSDIKPLVTHLHFVCDHCSQDFAHPLRDGKYSVPPPCCGISPSPNHAGPRTRTIDLQKVTLAEKIKYFLSFVFNNR